MPLFRFAALLCLALPRLLPAQTAPSTPRPIAPSLRPYTSCKIPGGPSMVQTVPLPDVPMQRAAQTLTGPKKLDIADGVFIAFAYTPGVPFANVKVEQLPAASYAREKADILSEFDAINAKGEDTQRNYTLKPQLNGFDAFGWDRTALDGKVLGMYLLFDNPHHVATTIYLLNATASRNFNTVAEYTGLRSGFLNAYSLCVRKALTGGAATSPKPKAKAPAPTHKRR